MFGTYPTLVRATEIEQRIRACGGEEAERWCRLEALPVVRHG